MDLGNANFVDKRLEQAVADESKSQADFIAKADEVLAALVKDFPSGTSPYGYRSTPREIYELTNTVNRAANLAWALRRFPVFDTSCMKMMRKEQGLKVVVKDRWGSAPETIFALDLWVPVFGMSQLPQEGSTAAQSWTPTSDNHAGQVIDNAMIAENRRELEAKTKNNSGSITLEAKCPPVPGAIVRKTNQLAGRFESTSIVWEAQWSAYQQVKDPLILGHIGQLIFLIDQFDASKLERYVMGEFCRSPKE